MSSTLCLGAPLISDDFDRPDDPNVGNGWTESSSAGDLVAIAGNSLQVKKQAPNQNQDGVVFRPLSETSGVSVSGTFEWFSNFDGTPFVAVNGSPHWAPFGLQLFFDGQDSQVQIDNGTTTVHIAPFVFLRNLAYTFEWALYDDYSTHLWLWSENESRPVASTTSSAATTLAVLAQPYFVIGGAGGAGHPNNYPDYEIRFDNIRVDALDLPEPPLSALLPVGILVLLSVLRPSTLRNANG
jgi:hypothetical protein